MSKSHKERIYNSFLSGTYQEDFCIYNQTIYFDYYELNYDKVVKIADKLENDNFFICASFYRCRIDNKSAIYLFRKLKNNKTIKKLYLHGNNIEESDRKSVV